MWNCDYKGDRITVTYRNKFMGDYTLLKEPYCLRCNAGAEVINVLVAGRAVLVGI